MKKVRSMAVAAAFFVSASSVLMGTATAVTPTKVHVAVPRTLLAKHITLSIQALVAHILKEECQLFPVLCTFVLPPSTVVPPSTTVPPTTVPRAVVSTTTTVVPPPTTVTSVPTTVITVPTVITLPVIVVPVPLAVPASSGGTSTCTVTMTGGGVSQCIQSASVSSSS